MSKIAQKREERRCLDRLRELFPSFPAGRISEAEPPDFLIETSDGVLGVEVCQWLHDAAAEGSPTRAHESLIWKVVQTARGLYDSGGGGKPQLNVRVDFQPHDRPSKCLSTRGKSRSGQNRALSRQDLLHGPICKKCVEPLARQILAVIAKHIPEPGSRTTVGWPEPNWKLLPPGVQWIGIARPAKEQDVCWTPEWGGGLPVVSPMDIEHMIRQKETLLPRYMKAAAQVWLLIVATGFNPSALCSIGPELLRHTFRTRFSRVFFLLDSESKLLSLRVA